MILWVRVFVVGGLWTLTCIKQSKLDFFIVNGFNPVVSKPVEYHRMVEPWSSDVILVRMIDVWQSKPRVCTVSGLKHPNIFQANVIVLVRVILTITCVWQSKLVSSLNSRWFPSNHSIKVTTDESVLNALPSAVYCQLECGWTVTSPQHETVLVRYLYGSNYYLYFRSTPRRRRGGNWPHKAIFPEQYLSSVCLCM